MSRISIPRLRRFVADRESAHAALMRSNENVRAARDRMNRAKEALTRYDETDGRRMPGLNTIDYRARYIADVSTARDAVDGAEAAQAAAHEAWEQVAALGTAAIDHARSIGQLPADLEDR